MVLCPGHPKKKWKKKKKVYQDHILGQRQQLFRPQGTTRLTEGYYGTTESPRKRREKDEMDLKERLLLLALFCCLTKLLFSYKKKYVSQFVFGLLCYCYFPLKIIQTSIDLYLLSAFLKKKVSSRLGFATKNASLGRNNLSLQDEFCRPSSTVNLANKNEGEEEEIFVLRKKNGFALSIKNRVEWHALESRGEGEERRNFAEQRANTNFP